MTDNSVSSSGSRLRRSQRLSAAGEGQQASTSAAVAGGYSSIDDEEEYDLVRRPSSASSRATTRSRTTNARRQPTVTGSAARSSASSTRAPPPPPHRPPPRIEIPGGAVIGAATGTTSSTTTRRTPPASLRSSAQTREDNDLVGGEGNVSGRDGEEQTRSPTETSATERQEQQQEEAGTVIEPQQDQQHDSPVRRPNFMNAGVQTETPREDQQTFPAPEWRLMIRTEPTRKYPRRELVRIRVTSSMTEERLSQCIEQVNGLDAVLGREWNVAGLFRESDGLFVSLNEILREGMYYSHEVWTLAVPHFHVPTVDPFWTDVIYILLSVAALIGVWILGPLLLELLNDWRETIFEVFVNLPLKEMYRYGPSFVGWEGMRLSKICSRITYHGDQEFWERNMHECERIYAMKEEAHLRTVRPILYFAFCLIGYWTIRALIHEWAQSRVEPPKIDRDMLETYEGFNMLVRQFNRALKPRVHEPPNYHDRRPRRRGFFGRIDNYIRQAIYGQKQA